MIEFSRTQKIFCILGTRPEFVKMFPVFKELQKRKEAGENIEVKWILSGQHYELIQDLIQFFGVEADYEFVLDQYDFDPGDSDASKLNTLGAKLQLEANRLFEDDRPDLVFVQGDTMTVQQVSLVAFYHFIPVAHIEAGIRTEDIYEPFPEELSRRIAGVIATLNFCPTHTSLKNLEASNLLTKRNSFPFYTGNTVIDAVKYCLEETFTNTFDWSKYSTVNKFNMDGYEDFDLINYIDNAKSEGRRIVLITAHRRENFGRAHSILKKLIFDLASEYSNQNTDFVISVHKNPKAQKPFIELVKDADDADLKNIHVVDAIKYPAFIKLLKASFLAVTDSGGIQEEAPYLATPVIVFRNVTERVEAIYDGLSKIAGTNYANAQEMIKEALDNEDAYKKMLSPESQIFGDGEAAKRIVDLTLMFLEQQDKAANSSISFE